MLCLALCALYMQDEDLFPASTVTGIAFCSFLFSPFFTLLYKYLVKYLYIGQLALDVSRVVIVSGYQVWFSKFIIIIIMNYYCYMYILWKRKNVIEFYSVKNWDFVGTTQITEFECPKRTNCTTWVKYVNSAW